MGGPRQDPGEPWPPASRDELDRRLRLDLCDERIELRNPAEFPSRTNTTVTRGCASGRRRYGRSSARCTMIWTKSSKRTMAKRSSAFSGRTDSCVTQGFRWTSFGQPSGPSEMVRQSRSRIHDQGGSPRRRGGVGVAPDCTSSTRSSFPGSASGLALAVAEPVCGLGVRFLGKGQHLGGLDPEHGGGILARAECVIANVEMPCASVLRLVGVGEQL